ncbi:MAG: hypothetical protein WBM32_07060 [Crocosphaera sp.]
MSQYTDFFEELITAVPYSLAVELKDLPKEEWAETTQQWFQDKLFLKYLEEQQKKSKKL